jgi:hypothetical protein
MASSIDGFMQSFFDRHGFTSMTLIEGLSWGFIDGFFDGFVVVFLDGFKKGFMKHIS